MVGTSGAIAARVGWVTASALSLPPWTLLHTVAAGPNIIGTRPASTSVLLWALPGEGIWVSRMRALLASSTPDRWLIVPAPDEAYCRPSGFALASAINSC